MKIRQPIITFVGHIDHGKTSLQDYIRQSSVIKTEAGKITQHIGSSNIPLDTVKTICGKLLDTLKLKFTIPGLLFVDTPGHAAFNNLRRRGGNLADIAILVIDINEGVMPQTLECIDILKQYKTPFIIALNKIDNISGWRKQADSLKENIDKQAVNVKNSYQEKLFTLMGTLYHRGFNAKPFYEISDFSKAIILNPNHGSAYFKRGMAKQINGDISGCCIDLKTAFDKGYLEAYHYLKKFCNK